jgi:hypothetical protein
MSGLHGWTNGGEPEIGPVPVAMSGTRVPVPLFGSMVISGPQVAAGPGCGGSVWSGEAPQPGPGTVVSGQQW